MKSVLQELGFGCVEINTGRVLGLVDSERNNPRLYDRKTYGRNSRKVPYQQIYSESERETVALFMDQLHAFLSDTPDLPGGAQVVGNVDIRSSDKFRILMSIPNRPKDRFVVYVRARKMNEIHLLFVPDFSFSTGGSSRKDAFRQFIDSRKTGVESAFGLPLYRPGGRNGFGDWLEITAQAWKGLSKIIARPLDSWQNRDFVEMIGHAMLDFMETTMPLLHEFDSAQKRVSE